MASPTDLAHIQQLYEKFLQHKARKDELVKQRDTLTTQHEVAVQTLKATYGEDWETVYKKDLDFLTTFEAQLATLSGA